MFATVMLYLPFQGTFHFASHSGQTALCSCLPAPQSPGLGQAPGRSSAMITEGDGDSEERKSVLEATLRMQHRLASQVAFHSV